MVASRRPYRLLCHVEPWGFWANVANLARLVFAVLWTLCWGTWRWARSSAEYAYHWQNDGKPRWLAGRRWAFSWGRHQSPKAMLCSDCGWAGPLRWADLWYAKSGHDDVEPEEYCPRCGAAALDPVLRGKKGWTS